MHQAWIAVTKRELQGVPIGSQAWLLWLQTGFQLRISQHDASAYVQVRLKYAQNPY